MSDPGCQDKKVLGGILGDAEITVLVDNETAVQNLTRMGKHGRGRSAFREKNPTGNFRLSFM